MKKIKGKGLLIKMISQISQGGATNITLFHLPSSPGFQSVDNTYMMMYIFYRI